ncbi:hypothetical protein NHG29_09155 [Aerococcaceae bacterium NML160702]|nr:hypothetical protein [Aerococcaceae bacterium NML160702]
MKLDERYKHEKVERVMHDQFERLHDYGGICTLYDDLKKELNRIPTPKEFLEQGLKLALAFFNEDNCRYCGRKYGYYTFAVDDELKQAIKSRLMRAYSSRLVEESVEDFLRRKYPKLKVYSNEYIDLNFGVDLAVVDAEKKRAYYLHVAKNNNYSKNHLDSKKNRKSYRTVGDKKIYWTRNWGKGHTLLAYNDELTDRMEEVQGHLVFNNRYLERFFSLLFASDRYDDGAKEIREFKKWLVDNKIMGAK